jgi:energy-coupling factor transporter ATP-binding protein EcfA2
MILERLRLENLCFCERGPVDLRVERSECVGITGPSGIGKSLLLRAVADIDPHTGFVFLNGIEAGSINAPEWRKMVGLMPAESSWWFETVGEHFDNLDKGSLDALGFEEDVRGWEVDRMSSGERQRLALLRLLANQSKVLLLDEPTANLDSKNIDSVEQYLSDYGRKYDSSLIWVSHDLPQLKRVADRCYYMEKSSLREI